ncbi:MAG TPA: hypothetical protein H9679_07365 [Firmicutes bacterium]|nr:hypothetical protein [Bacillota bacterium]
MAITAMWARFKNFQIRQNKEEKVNPKLTAYQIELTQIEAEIEKLQKPRQVQSACGGES